MKLNSTHCIVRSEDPVSAEIDGEVVMMSIENGNYYGLDSIGTRIWELIKVAQPISQLIAQLTKEYDVDVSICSSHTLELLQHFLDEKLIETIEPNSNAEKIS